MLRALLYLFIVATLLSGCSKDASMEESALYGTWVKEGGGLPADTLHFFSKDNKNIVAFEFGPTGGINWPAHVEAEYSIVNDKLAIKDASGTTNEFFIADSFEWIQIKKAFSVKLYQVVQYISADYTVTFRKLE
jgi:hypothetical protein